MSEWEEKFQTVTASRKTTDDQSMRERYKSKKKLVIMTENLMPVRVGFRK